MSPAAPAFRRRGLIGLLGLCLWLLAAGDGAARAAPASSPWVRTDFADIRLISAVAGVGDSESLPLGLQFALPEGWKVYWRAPGDAGFPPTLDWTGSTNLAAVEWQWPVPQRFSLFGLESFGYSGEVVYPLRVKPADPSRPVALRAALEALACNEICVPLEASLSLSLPAGPAAPTAFTQLISRYRARVPGREAAVGLELAGLTAVGEPAPHSLRVDLRSDRPLRQPDVFVEAARGFAFGQPAVEFSADRRRALLTLPASLPPDQPLAGQQMLLTLVDGERFVEAPGRVGMAAPGSGFAAEAPPSTRILILTTALLGGLILNLMPCVLPVLSLKLLAVVGFGGAAARRIRRGFLASAAGVMACFLALALAAIGLKSAGIAIGWGIQFQQPLFLAAMMLVLTGFAANLWGWFEIPLPRRLADAVAVTGGGNGRAGDGLASHFAAGIFATLLATPCSAPFVGTALGFALARGAGDILAVFAALGLGLAAPWLAVAAFPGLVAVLPRPGRWMLALRRLLGLALAATALWLASVLAAQIGWRPAGLALAATGLGLLLLAGARAGRKHGGRVWPSRAAMLALLPVAAVVLVLAGWPGGVGNGLRASAGGADGAPAAIGWTRWEPALPQRLAGAGQVVLVDVTADWCLTCQVNKRLVLDRGAVGRALASGAVTPMRADWTAPDPAIAAYLASYGRYGIPFNAVYGPRAPAGIPLPELLTEATVMAAITQAGG